MLGARPGLICSGVDADFSLATGKDSVIARSVVVAGMHPGRAADPLGHRKAEFQRLRSHGRASFHHLRRWRPRSSRSPSCPRPAVCQAAHYRSRSEPARAAPGGPTCNRVDIRQSLRAGRGIGHADPSRHSGHMSEDGLRVSDQLRFDPITNADPRHLGLLEISVDPIAVGVALSRELTGAQEFGQSLNFKQPLLPYAIAASSRHGSGGACGGRPGGVEH
jgi:hypothetical protein